MSKLLQRGFYVSRRKQNAGQQDTLMTSAQNCYLALCWTRAPDTMKYLLSCTAAYMMLFLSACGSSSGGSTCFSITPDETYIISGTAMTQAFSPDSKTYTVRNTCSADADLSVEEDVRWLDIEIAAFGADEFGTVPASGSVAVVIEVRYGSDLPDRLDQLPAGAYQTPVDFVDETNGGSTSRSVNLTVN